MSNDALRWAFNIAITGPSKAVLVALADHADDAGECYPSVGRLAFMAGLSERGARKCLRDLEAAGLVETQTKDGHRSRYKLALDVTIDPGTTCPPSSNGPRNIVPGGEAQYSALTPEPRAGEGGIICRGGRNHVPGTPEPRSPKPLLTPIEPPEGSLRAAPPPIWPDARAELWGDGLALLRGLTGKPDGPSRALLGKLLKAARDDCPLVMAKLRAAADLRPVEPVAWLTAACAPQANDDARLLAAVGLAPMAAGQREPFDEPPLWNGRLLQ